MGTRFFQHTQRSGPRLFCYSPCPRTLYRPDSHWVVYYFSEDCYDSLRLAKCNCLSFIQKGDREDAWNYQSVSLTLLVCKIMESILKTLMMNHLIRTAAIPDAHHGFVPRHSCLINLYLLAEQWVTELIHGCETVVMVFLDFTDVFDQVNTRCCVLI